MSKNEHKVMLVTGASSGMGKSIANYYYKLGFRVYGTSRKLPAPDSRITDQSSGGFLEMIQLDVCSDESVKNAVDYVSEKEGHIDIFINCAVSVLQELLKKPLLMKPIHNLIQIPLEP